MVKRYGAGTMLAVAVTVLIWSTTFAALVSALSHFSPQHLLVIRWTLTSLLFVAYGLATRMRLPQRRDLPQIALAGLLGFAAYQMLLVYGQTGVSASMAGFLVNMNPVFTTVIAVALRRESSSWATWTGLGICVGGLALMTQAGGGFGQIGLSAGLVVLAALSFALYTLVTKPLLGRYRPLEVTAYATIAGSIPFLVFAPGAGQALATASLSDLATVVFLAVLPGGIAYVLWSRAVSGLTPGLASRFLYLIPVLGLGVAWVWVGEVPAPLTVAGGLLTIAGVALSSMKPAPAPIEIAPLHAEKPAVEAA